MSLSWYDVLGVEPTASTDEIRDAWRVATADLEPTDRRFDLYNDAAKVLLDPTARAAYDVELGVAVAGEPHAAADLDSEDGASATDLAVAGGGPTEGAGGSRRGLAALAAPIWLLVAMALAAALVAAGTWWTALRADEDHEDAVAEARAVAEANFGNVLTYRWDDLETAYQRATAVLTDDYRAEFDQVWELVESQAANLKAVVRTDVLRTGVVRTSDDGKRVELGVVIRNSVTNAGGDQGTGHLMLGVTMVDQDGTWLIADISGLGTDAAGDGADDDPDDPSSDQGSDSSDEGERKDGERNRD